MSVALRIRGLSKTYGGVRALQSLDFEMQSGAVHAICGENGAGKSTLIKCLAGVIVPDKGEAKIEGQALPWGDVQAAEALGIHTLHQESTVFLDLNTIDNLFVGRELRYARWFTDHREMRRRTEDTMKRLGQNFDIRRPLRELSVAQRQLVAMARAVMGKCRVLILDEPTASLSQNETQTLLGIIAELRNKGVAILYISHRLDEIFEIADKVTVLRDGEHVSTSATDQINRDQLIRWMVGRNLSSGRAEELRQTGEQELEILEANKPLLEVRNLTGVGFREVSFVVPGGQIVGLAGLVGAGRSEVAKAIFGINTYWTGNVLLNGRPLPKNSVPSAAKRGLALVPEDRQHEGLVLPMSIQQNLTMAALPTLAQTPLHLIPQAPEIETAHELVEELGIKVGHVNDPVATLSGGNQQKVVIAKWLACAPKVLILDEPTRGVDVQAKGQIHDLIRRVVRNEDGDEPHGVLLISSELPELLKLCDQIVVMCEGRVTATLARREATQESILSHALPSSH